MLLPASIRPSVSPATIDKVGRLFNGSAGDVLNELLQNARRAGASRVDIVQTDLAGHSTLIVRDDGRGIDDPAKLLSLGASAWSDRTQVNEDPAGMGVFAMAGLRVEYRSYSQTAGQGWRVVIDADAWSGARDLAIEPFDIGGGTEVLIDLPESWEVMLKVVVTNAALHYPLPVFFQGLEVERRDWLADALHIERWRGSRIGVFQEPARPTVQRLNFHGLAVPLSLPSVGEVGRGLRWGVRLDIGETPELQLVLPARKEVVQTPFLEELRAACEAAIYRAIAKGRSHRLAFKDFLRARELGVPLVEADPVLDGWTPAVPYGGEAVAGSPIRRPMILVGDVSPALAQTLARAVTLHPELDLPLAEREDAFRGYRWYDDLEHVGDITLTIERGEQVTVVKDEFAELDLPSGPADRLVIGLEIDAPDGLSRGEILPTDVAIVTVDEYTSDIDSVAIIVAPERRIEIPALVDMLVAAAFSPSDDRDADSYDTQRDNFERNALQIARTLLISEDAGILGRAIDRVDGHIRWLVPEGRTLLIATGGTETMACFLERPARFDSEDAFTRQVLAHATRAIHDPSQAADAVAHIRVAAHERALDLMALSARGRGGEGGGEAG